ncbi:glycosyltransferase family 2 protein [Amanita thiersii Skay4041]|uniref:chitin synthase n=1 Tax=Amanita thiersii Skay4041 TaxID=703135 RepID=A0A2A9NRV7_9AGAR|nr:glycosyltransferase family 2 protein [Amanita thiersii Skay4041]
MASSSLSHAAISSGNLVDLVSSSGPATVYPSDDTILAVLQARFRSDLPYSRIGTTNLVLVNPYKTLANVNDVSAQEYLDRCYKDTSLPMVDSTRPLQPHLYEMAAKIYLLMRRRNESQAVVARGITGSGKSSGLRLLTHQLLRLSSHSKKETKVAEQIKSFFTVLDSFGNAKTLMNPNASRHGRYLELHFTPRGRISGAKVLTYALDKSRLTRLSHEERTYHVFYQFLAGATGAERDFYGLEDPSDYALLASSGTYRLPAGPFSDDSIGMSELRGAMKTLGFKQKHTSAIFSLLVAILLLGNITFRDGDAHDVAAAVTNTPVLEHAARLLGVTPEDLSQTLTTKTKYVKKELFTVLLDAEQSAAQRDRAVRDLYAILFAFVVESANQRLAPSSKDPLPHTQIMMLDQPGFQTRGPSGTTSIALSGQAPLLHNAYGQNGFDEFCINFTDELLQSYVLRHTFEDTIGLNAQIVSDGISLPAISTMDNGACVELLRGAGLSEQSQRKPAGLLGMMNKAATSYKSGKGSQEHRDEDMLQLLHSTFGVHASFVASPSPIPGGNQDRTLFGINHYAGQATYDVSGWVEKDADLLDAAFVILLRGSSESFVSKLLSGPSLAAEKHYKDESIVVQAQVSSLPLRHITPVLVHPPSPPPYSDPQSYHQQSASELPIQVPRLDPTKTYPVTTQLNNTMSEVFAALDRSSRLWAISCIRPNDSASPNSFDKRRVKAQVRALLLPDIVARKCGSEAEFVVGYDKSEFCNRFVPTMQGREAERIEQCARANGWREGRDYAVGGGGGIGKVWLTYEAWKGVEDVVRVREKELRGRAGPDGDEDDEGGSYLAGEDGTDYGDGGASLGVTHQDVYYNESADNLLPPGHKMYANESGSYGEDGQWVGGNEWDKRGGSLPGSPGLPSVPYSPRTKEGIDGQMVVKDVSNTVEEVPSSRTRRWWLWMVWATTWWMPSFLLRLLGRMKRPDVRLAWREKVTIFWLIFLLNAVVIFYIIEFGRLLCPQYDKAWTGNEVMTHQGENDYFVSVRGVVYDVSNFVRGDHSGIIGMPSNAPDTLDALAGQDLSYYFPPPLTLACPDVVTDPILELTPKNFTNLAPLAMHKSGGQATGAFAANDWYTAKFLKKMREFKKGPLVWDKKDIQGQARDLDIAKIWAVYEESLYDLTDYVWTQSMSTGNAVTYSFLDQELVNIFKQRAGQDVTQVMQKRLDAMDGLTRARQMNCLNNYFKVGITDFRKTPRCQVQQYMLLIASGILMTSMALKFLAALQLGIKRTPELQDKFVLCQVPCYTEGEDSLRRTIDSLAALNYDDKRKLIFIICDGNIIGSGNDRTTPRIVLDILGVDPKLDPEPLLFKSVGEGSRALNYGKVYSGLYEFEGHVVPYMVVVKVGKPTERSKPGNRGKRDSQILLLHYLNRVHFDAPMSPLELEVYHQMRNVIGIDPAFYEYIFTVDADTTVTPDSLNRLIATCADDSSVIGCCGETKLDNEETSWWTMIQVYEYYISHHLSKAFESLFGSVTCLPGCFSLYRIRTADKGRPVIISNRIIDEYAEPNVDTLHKKNLFSLGEDRFLTTLLMKHYPTFKTKFCPDAVAHTIAPESWRILFSQRRRWINSTVHNLCELVILPELFGFCCFSMRFFVFIDLLGTLLIYLIVVVSIHASAFPKIAIIMLAVTYGLQAIIFILKREFMLVGWMVVYILSYPVYSFFLPVYSFWCMDEFSWGNTRLVVGEGKDKKIIVNEDEKFDDSMIPLKKFSEYEAEAWETGSRHSDETGYSKPHSKSRSHAPRSREDSPHTYQQASQSGDYYRDTNVMNRNSSHPNLRQPGSNSQLSHSNISHNGGGQQQQMSQYGGAPQLPFMPFGGGPGSIAGSDYGHSAMPMPPLGYQNTGSMYGMMPPMMPQMTGMNMFGGSFGGSQSGGPTGVAPSLPPVGLPQQRPMSTFSLATSVNPFAGPSNSTDPTDEELYNALRNYLSTQDLMSVTKKTAREAIMAKFPKADLTNRKDFLNQTIDKILSES